jgi:hypothetical protein
MECDDDGDDDSDDGGDDGDDADNTKVDIKTASARRRSVRLSTPYKKELIVVMVDCLHTSVTIKHEREQTSKEAINTGRELASKAQHPSMISFSREGQP